MEKCKTECCECVQDGGTVCCYCDAGPNVFCLTEDFNLNPEEVAKIRSQEKKKSDE
jgi:mevalonate pyrophosphate decarboxylase